MTSFAVERTTRSGVRQRRLPMYPAISPPPVMRLGMIHQYGPADSRNSLRDAGE